jgi:hypothetical protein
MANKASAHPRGELAKLWAIAVQAGWSVTRCTGSGHWRWSPPQGGKPVYTGNTPGEGRAHANALARLRRAGLRVNGR